MNDNDGIQKPSGLPKPLPFPLESRGPVQQNRVLRQKLDYSPQHWQAGSSRLPSSRVMLPAYAGPCLGSRPVAWLDGMVEILVLVEFSTGKGRERVRV